MNSWRTFVSHLKANFTHWGAQKYIKQEDPEAVIIKTGYDLLHKDLARLYYKPHPIYHKIPISPEDFETKKDNISSIDPN
jgi:hypothetical protein